MTKRISRSGAGGSVGMVVAAILAAVLDVEGGYVNNPDDPGGATNHGITEATARANGYRGAMRDLTRAQALAIYEKRYVTEPGFTAVVERSHAIGEELIDTGVNTGQVRAALWLQESLNHFNRKGADYPDVPETGSITTLDLAAYDALVRKRGARNACILMMRSMDAKQAQHYMRLAARRDRFESFMPGWFFYRIGNVDVKECG